MSLERGRIRSADPERLRRDVERLSVGLENRYASHPEVLDRAALFLADELAAAGARVREQEYRADDSTYRNVVGSVGPEQGGYVVVGAHYDACGVDGVNPGADDNASGTAGLLELARLLAPAGLGVRVDLVAYSTEEPPYFGTDRMGSAIHARSLLGDSRLEAMICLEMIGYFSAEQPWPPGLLEPADPGHGYFVAITGRPVDRTLVERVAAAFRARGEIEAISYSGPPLAGLGLSDHRNYWGLGIPSVMIGDTAFVRNPNYHRPTDTAETLDYPRMARVVDGVAAVLAAWRG